VNNACWQVHLPWGMTLGNRGLVFLSQLFISTPSNQSSLWMTTNTTDTCGAKRGRTGGRTEKKKEGLSSRMWLTTCLFVASRFFSAAARNVTRMSSRIRWRIKQMEGEHQSANSCWCDLDDWFSSPSYYITTTTLSLSLARFSIS
jgi:hypothetical protein